MKRIIAVGMLSLGVFALMANTSFAGCLKCKRKCAEFCVKPYNAFSPVACGSICLDGCLPIGSCNAGMLNYQGSPVCLGPNMGADLQQGTAFGGPMIYPPIFAQPNTIAIPPQPQPFNGIPVSAPAPQRPQAEAMPATPWGGPVNPVGYQQPPAYPMPIPYGYPPANVPSYWLPR